MAYSKSPNEKLDMEDWGLIPYDKAFALQDEYVQKIIKGEKKETLVFCSHPPVVTLGRGTKAGDLFAWAGETIEVNRGGRATYHGPSQIVMYPLLKIDGSEESFAKKTRPRDLHQYLRVLEQSVVELLKAVGVESQGRSIQQQVGEELAEEATGVWIGDKKMASMGIAVRKWVTSHGAALNIQEDPEAFMGMNPCGFKSEQMTNLERITGKRHDRELLQKLWGEIFLDLI